jgi:hypothetical protein
MLPGVIACMLQKDILKFWIADSSTSAAGSGATNQKRGSFTQGLLE